LGLHVTAALRRHLILEMNPSRTRGLKPPDCPPNIESVAVARIGISQNGSADSVADPPADLSGLVHRHEPDVGYAKERRRHSETCQRKKVVSKRFTDSCRESVIGP